MSQSTTAAPIQILQQALQTIAGMDEEHFALSYDLWKHKAFSKMNITTSIAMYVNILDLF